jgi:ABC-2 type transport system permease protein
MLAALVAGLTLLAAAFGAISLFVSCLTVHPVVAAIGAFAALLGTVLAGEVAGDGLRARGWTVAASLTQVFSPIKNFEPFGKGLLDTHAAACLILLTALCLALAIRQLDAQRLRG